MRIRSAENHGGTPLTSAIRSSTVCMQIPHYEIDAEKGGHIALYLIEVSASSNDSDLFQMLFTNCHTPGMHTD